MSQSKHYCVLRRSRFRKIQRENTIYLTVLAYASYPKMLLLKIKSFCRLYILKYKFFGGNVTVIMVAVAVAVGLFQ
jgi:hypothetical protein